MEKGKVVWNDDGIYYHLRIDQCVIKNEPYKRADCAIFYVCHGEDHVYLFIIEVKENWYSLSEVKDKITNTIDKLRNELKYINEKITIIPILYANRHISNARRTFHAYTISLGTKKQSIKYLHNGTKVVKAIS